MQTHAHFEELCVLATAGQLSSAESDALNQHLVACDRCRVFLKDAQVVSDRILPQALPAVRAESRIGTRTPPGMRERFLARAASQGLKIDARPPLAIPSSAPEPVTGLEATASAKGFAWTDVVSSLRKVQIWAIAGAACAACFVLGLVVRNQYRPQPRSDQSVLQAPISEVAPAVVPANAELGKMRTLTADRDKLAGQVADLALQLQTVEGAKQQTESTLKEQLATARSNDHDALVQQLTALSAKAADLQSQLDSARQNQLLAETDLRNARVKTAEYSARLDLLQTQLRSQEVTAISNPNVPSPNEVSDLVAARNLHIIDVYDSNAKGQRGRAFGRVFYVEGRSLVFYAYDLVAAHAQKNITFHLWGEKAGSKETTLSLGVLHDDDPQERRWALTCNDPALLAKINSVYVTAESASKQNDAPRGPRVLYAYFGAPPNHP